MAIVISPKFGLKTYTAGADPHPSRVEFNAMISAIEDWGVTSQKGLASARPTAGQEGRLYWASDQSRIYYDDGVAWQELTSNGGGGAGAALNIGGTGSEGTSSRSARADHVHPLPLASATVNGAMSTLDKNKLDGAVSTATALRLVIRDGSGRAQFGDPSVAADAATKGYVDVGLALKSNVGHTHSYAELTDAPTTNAPIQWTDVLNKPATFPPTIGITATTAKAGNYVPAWSEITSKPATFTPSAHTHLWADITDKPATFAPIIGTTATTAKAGNYVPTWAEITSKPATFAPTIGTTATTAKAGNWTPSWNEVVGKPTVFPSDWTNVAGKPATFAPSSHGHDVNSGDIYGQPGFVNQRAFNDFAFSENQRQQNDINYVNSRVDSTWNFAAGKLGNGDYGVWHDDAGISSWHTFNVSAAYNGQYRALWVHQDGRFGYNLSSRKFKTNERDYVVPLDTLKAMSPKWFQYKSDIEAVGEKDAMWRANFIAEDLYDNDLKEFVSFDGNGTGRDNCQSINESFLVTTLWSFCQQQQELIEGLQKQIDELKETP